MVTIESTADMAAKIYETMERNLAIVRRRLGRPLTLADKVLLGHADDPEHQSADRPREKPDPEDEKRDQVLVGLVHPPRRELLADLRREITVDGVVEPLEDVADQTGRRGPQRRLPTHQMRLGAWQLCGVSGIWARFHRAILAAARRPWSAERT